MAYASGMITTQHTFAQMHGVFRFRMKMAEGDNQFPAAWLMPMPPTWPPEIDVVEYVGSSHALRFTAIPAGPSYDSTEMADLPDPTTAVRDFEIDWRRDTLRWFYEGELVKTSDLGDLPEFRQSMYLIVNNGMTGMVGPGTPATSDIFVPEVAAWLYAQ
jgi:beta-glucanase (GH16 family)